jgi:hypothetical protein
MRRLFAAKISLTLDRTLMFLILSERRKDYRDRRTLPGNSIKNLNVSPGLTCSGFLNVIAFPSFQTLTPFQLCFDWDGI